MEITKGTNPAGNQCQSKSQVTAIIIGAGVRGCVYADHALDRPDEFKIVGVAEPRLISRTAIAGAHNISSENVFKDWSHAAEKEKFADCVIISTMNHHHKDPAIAFARKGYHILLEKPMALTEKDCKDVVRECKESGVIFAVCHVLRYQPQVAKMKEIISSGQLGDVINIQYLEPQGYWWYPHSFVRGNRSNYDDGFLLLQACCHDVDIICYLMDDRKCQRVSSFGSLMYFNKKNKPSRSGDRCDNCEIETSCAFSSKKIYMDSFKKGNRGFPVNQVTEIMDVESLTDSLRTGPYGRCVYSCDNNQPDNQVVMFQYENGSTASLTYIGMSEKVVDRQVRVFGTKGELRCNISGSIRTYDFLTQKEEIYEPPAPPENTRLTQFFGADFYMMQSFVNAVKNNDPSLILTGPDDSLQSHLLVFAAERARLTGTVVEL
ncbi:unnamed protein product [Owenia fusiformis]|uniref:Gfo/Idh/MocA family oxidoreductase n=1 Tax=Owenia fusiformis TaxID=6347 RepID=A0A8S4P2Z9_OWEFU|nr:unnamed protein product [Owenia fusiformis]